MENGEELFKCVFENKGFEDHEQHFEIFNVPTEDVNQYLQQLSTFGLEKLAKELNRITEDKSSLISQTQEVAFQEYPTFIETSQCTHEISLTFQKEKHSTEKLSENLVDLKEKCKEFSKMSQSLNAARSSTSLALSRHTQVLEFLELPQLMDTCVRNGYWEEALDLAAHVSRLERKLSYIPLILKVAAEVQSCTKLMLSQLISQLRMPAQLPHCLKVVGYLRRMGVFSEEEIRLKFLQARDAWFKSTLGEIPKDDAYQHIMKTIELSRVHLFDIATQYRAIFTDEDPLVLANQNANTNESAIFHSWIIQKVADFLTTLQSDLPKVSPSSLESVFGQCMYFGLSFGRIGSDFRALLVPIFTQVVYDRFDQSMDKAAVQFADSMASFSVLTSSSSSSSSSSLFPNSTDQIQPPYDLMKFGPLAELCNRIIAVFNELRLCAPVQLVGAVARKLELKLKECSQIISDFHLQEKAAFTSIEEQEFFKCVQLYHIEFLRYIQKILSLLFPASLLSVQTGFLLGDIIQQDLTVLDMDFIVLPIYHLLVIQEFTPPLFNTNEEQFKTDDSTNSHSSNQKDVLSPSEMDAQASHSEGVKDPSQTDEADSSQVGDADTQVHEVQNSEEKKNSTQSEAIKDSLPDQEIKDSFTQEEVKDSSPQVENESRKTKNTSRPELVRDCSIEEEIELSSLEEESPIAEKVEHPSNTLNIQGESNDTAGVDQATEKEDVKETYNSHLQNSDNMTPS